MAQRMVEDPQPHGSTGLFTVFLFSQMPRSFVFELKSVYFFSQSEMKADSDAESMSLAIVLAQG